MNAPIRYRDFRRVRSLRRHYLNALLATLPPASGQVVDLGGKRGVWRQAPAQTHILNIDPQTQPDVIADASYVPLRTGSVDVLICTEVLEHLRDPVACVAEVYRTLRPRGTFVASVPFFYPFHADPLDMHRWTADGLRYLLRAFSDVDIRPMGGWLGALGLILEQGSGHRQGLRRRLGWESGRVLQWLDTRRDQLASSAFTGGYFVVALK